VFVDTRWLFERCSRKSAHEAAKDDQWRGLALYGVDGTTIRPLASSCHLSCAN
jgi:hypothetical protein